MRKTGSVALRKGRALWIVLFTAVMLAFCLFMLWYVPAMSDMEFRLSDVSASLETSRGRERKQQFEYDEVTEQLPKLRAELADTQPRADAAQAEVAALKDERKKLREEKERLKALFEDGAADETACDTGEKGTAPAGADATDKAPDNAPDVSPDAGTGSGAVIP